jgi:hypothetical protein
VWDFVQRASCHEIIGSRTGVWDAQHVLLVPPAMSRRSSALCLQVRNLLSSDLLQLVRPGREFCRGTPSGCARVHILGLLLICAVNAPLQGSLTVRGAVHQQLGCAHASQRTCWLGPPAADRQQLSSAAYHLPRSLAALAAGSAFAHHRRSSTYHEAHQVPEWHGYCAGAAPQQGAEHGGKIPQATGLRRVSPLVPSASHVVSAIQ